MGPDQYPEVPSPGPAGATVPVRRREATVAGRRAPYCVAGRGPTVVFLHGWALGRHAYAASLSRLAGRGFEVLMPDLPGFGNTPLMALEDVSFPSYAGWADAFLDEVGVTGPVTLVGHSFGGGVATQVAHDFRTRVSGVVLLNSIGGPTWYLDGGEPRPLSERPIGHWLRRLNGEVMPHSIWKIPAMTRDLFPNAVLRTRALWRVGELARKADLRAELKELARSGVPVMAVWSEEDHVIPKASFEDLCTSLGQSGRIVPGRHSWPFSDPAAFAALVARFADSPQGGSQRPGSHAV